MRVWFTPCSKLCSPNGYECAAPRVANKSYRVHETFSCRIQMPLDNSFFPLPFYETVYEPRIITRVPTFAVVVYDELFTGKSGTRGANRVSFVSCSIPPHIAAIRYIFSVRHFPYSLQLFAVSFAFSAYYRFLRTQKISERQKPRAAQWLRGANFGALHDVKAESGL